MSKVETFVSFFFPQSPTASLIVFKGIFINKNLTSHRRELLKETNRKRKDNIIMRAWSMDGKIIVKISPASSLHTLLLTFDIFLFLVPPLSPPGKNKSWERENRVTW